jgi:3-hydroxybutyryl-CoA dehydrogenase
MKQIAVVGAGTMGAGIAQIAAEAGYEVRLKDVDEKFVEKGRDAIKRFVARKLEKGKLTQKEYQDIVGRLQGTTDLTAALKGAELVIEAIPEKMDLKKALFKEMAGQCDEGTVLASNTSTLSITEIASTARYPERVVGMHFFNPVPLMQLVEVVRGGQTSEGTVRRAADFCEKVGKTAILVKDIPGFIVNRFLCLLYNEGAAQVQNRVASNEDIDKGLKLGANHPMGILELMDVVGVDVVYYALQSLWESTREERYRPCSLLREMVESNRLGRKTGIGFYTYDKRD